VSIVDNIAQHARWKASKLNREIYGDKTVVEGGDIPIRHTFTLNIDNV
jgi:hypothetical protein